MKTDPISKEDEEKIKKDVDNTVLEMYKKGMIKKIKKDDMREG